MELKYKYKLNQNTIEYLLQLVNANKELFSEEKFRNWYWENNIEFKSNPDKYLKAIFEKELKDGRFKPDQLVPNCLPLFNAMRQANIEVNHNDTLYISVMEKHLLQEGQITIEELRELNHTILNYIVGKYEKPTSKHFIEMFKKSKRKFNFEGTENELSTIRKSL